MASWDRRTPQQLAVQREQAVKAQVLDAVAPFSPWWRERLRALGRTAESVATTAGLASVPAVGERDVCPDGDPRGAAALVLQAGEAGWALHAEGPRLRQGLARRLVLPGSYSALVEADTRATSFTWAGLSLRFPVASTRTDLDVVARAGARLWQVLGLTRADVVVSGLPTEVTAPVQALTLGALGAGSPLLAPGASPVDVAAALRLVPATVLALPVDSAADTLEELAETGAELRSVTTVLLAGPPSDRERAAVRNALGRAGVGAACAILAMHVPDGHRLAWGECRESQGRTGLHTYPDLEVVDAVDPETGEAPRGGGPRELVLTQLGLRGTALLRWRTGDLVDGVEASACSACGRTVPRVVGTRPAALVPRLGLGGRRVGVDLRAVCGALVGRGDVADWRVVLGPSRRDRADQLLVHVAPGSGVDPTDVAVAVAADVRSTAGLLPSQIVVEPAGRLPAVGQPLSPRVLVRT